MKKLIAILLALTLMISFCACGKSEEVTNVENLITAIGTVTESSESDIIQAERAFDALTDEEKNEVENYNMLLLARNEFNAIPKEVTLTKHNFEDYFKIQLSYGEMESGALLGMMSYQDYPLNIEIFPIASGDFNNVEVSLEIYAPIGFEIALTDNAYNEDDTSLLTLSYVLPVDGKCSDTHYVRNWGVYSEPSSCTYVITSVSGTVIE